MPSWLSNLVWLLVVVGGLNWGLVGLFDFNLVSTIFGAGSVGEQVVYIVVGVAAVLALGLFPKLSK